MCCLLGTTGNEFLDDKAGIFSSHFTQKNSFFKRMLTLAMLKDDAVCVHVEHGALFLFEMTQIALWK